MSKTENKNSLEMLRDACDMLKALCEVLLNESTPPRVKLYRKKILMRQLDEVITTLNAKGKKTSS